jgi:hypothetical protein
MAKQRPQSQPATAPPSGLPTAVNPLPTQPKELLIAQKLLGQAVRASVGGHMATIWLTDYDIGSNSYAGLLVRNVSMNVGDTVPHFEAVHGLRPYPYDERPDYAFQFITPGTDESVLINIAQANAVRQ